MRKNLFFVILVLLTCATKTWGQVLITNVVETPFSAALKSNGPFVYDRTEKTGAYIDNTVVYHLDYGNVTYSVSGSNCSYYDSYGSLTGAKGTNAGTYTAIASVNCQAGVGSSPDPINAYPAHAYQTAPGPDIFVTIEHHCGNVTLDWEILPRDISKTSGYADAKYVTVTVTDQAWTGSAINISSAYNIQFEGVALVEGTDYDVYVTMGETPTQVKDEGRYTIVFVGKGNFTGTVTKTFDVKKDMSGSEATTGIHFDIPTQVIPNATGTLTFATDFQMVATDTKSFATMYEGTDYTLAFSQASTTDEGKFTVTVTGVAPKYSGTRDIDFYVAKEYQTTSPTDGTAPASLRIAVPGYPVAAYSPTGIVVRGEMQVGGVAPAPAVATTSTRVKLPGDFTTAIGGTDITFNVVGIDDKAFNGCSAIRYIDALAIKNYTPATLNRSADSGPFAGLPAQTLVYLTGPNIDEENYIFYTGLGYNCDTYKIYDDVNGNQKGFDTELAAKWGAMIPIAFKAKTVVNTRQLHAVVDTKQQGYTVCLPYAMPIPEDVKIYKLAYSKTNQVGFTEVTTGILAAMTPYVAIASDEVQPFCTTNATIVQTYNPATPGYIAIAPVVSQAVSGQGLYKLTGTMEYLSGATDMYIMQKDNLWTPITSVSDYPYPCVLPMRAYIQANGTATARLFSTFSNADGSTTVVNGLQLDADPAGEIYDLQGRKVTTPQRGGLYIVNGKKMIVK